MTRPVLPKGSVCENCNADISQYEFAPTLRGWAVGYIDDKDHLFCTWECAGKKSKELRESRFQQ